MGNFPLSRQGEEEIRQWMQSVLPEIFRSLISAQCRKAEIELSGDILLFTQAEYYTGWVNHPLGQSYIPVRFAISLPDVVDDFIELDAFVYAWDDHARVDPEIPWLEMDKSDLRQWLIAQIDFLMDGTLASVGNIIYDAHRVNEYLSLDVVIVRAHWTEQHSWGSESPPPTDTLRGLVAAERAKKLADTET